MSNHMTNEECFDAWAPDGVAWSQWAKPALFAHLPPANAAPPATPLVSPPAVPAPAAPAAPLDIGIVPEARGGTAVVADLPGAEAVGAGIALAWLGYRPVPLFNAAMGPGALLDLAPVVGAVQVGAATLRDSRIRPDAPPAFLLDAGRMAPGLTPSPGRFDNRWIVLPQDLPSATYLPSRGISEVVLLQAGSTTPLEDLAHVLLRWQRGGVRILAADVRAGGRAQPIEVKPPHSSGGRGTV